MGILKQAIDGGNLIPVVPYKNRIVGFTVVQGDTLLYSCSNNGRDEAWAYVISQDKNYLTIIRWASPYYKTITSQFVPCSLIHYSSYMLIRLSGHHH